MPRIKKQSVNISASNNTINLGSRIPPQAVDVEKAVLGAMLIEKEAAPKVLELLDHQSFYNPTNQKIYQAMMSLFEKGDPIDAVTVVEELRRRGELNSSEDPLYITELTLNITTAANVEYHARIVLEKALMRSLISASAEIGTRAYSDTEDALDLLDEAESKIFQISERQMKRSFTPINRALHETFEMLQEIHGKHSGITGSPSGFPALDEKTGGFQKSDLIIVAGRPSQGKTAFALSVARNAALHKEKKCAVAIFSIEMSERQLIIRMLSSEARVNAHELRTGRLHEDKWKNLSRNVGRLAEAKIFIDDTPALSMLELRAKSRRLKAEHEIGLIIVDYLQLIQGPKNSESREREISMISRSLKALAKEIDVPVIALSQLNRAVEARGDKRPMLADLRESGAIEQDADVVIFVHRPETYGILEIKDDEGGIMPSEGLAEIIIGKQRNGPTGIVRLQFHKEYASFEKLEQLIAPPEYIPEDSPF
ncbi:MAG: replicative DNA helicase [Ignavibacteriales bacterium]|nr:replicative DNA helicase [Ignavibacteriales bacterium]